MNIEDYKDLTLSQLVALARELGAHVEIHLTRDAPGKEKELLDIIHTFRGKVITLAYNRIVRAIKRGELSDWNSFVAWVHDPEDLSNDLHITFFGEKCRQSWIAALRENE